MTTAADILSPTTPGAAPPTDGNALPATAPATIPANPAPTGWWDGVKDPELKGFLANKAYDSPETLGKAYRSLEQLFGADKAGRTAVMPKDDADIEGRKAFYSKIGVPDTVDGYKLPLPTGDDGAFAKTAAGWFHEFGIPAKAAEGIAAKWNEFIGNQVTNGTAQETAAKAAELDKLKIEWAHDFDSKTELARRGMAEVGTKAGFDKPTIERMEAAIGTAATLKLFSQLGSLVGEAGFAGGSGGGTFGMTVAKANERINELHAGRANGTINDRQWRTEAEPEIDRLMKVLVDRAA